MKKHIHFLLFPALYALSLSLSIALNKAFAITPAISMNLVAFGVSLYLSLKLSESLALSPPSTANMVVFTFFCGLVQGALLFCMPYVARALGNAPIIPASPAEYLLSLGINTAIIWTIYYYLIRSAHHDQNA